MKPRGKTELSRESSLSEGSRVGISWEHSTASAAGVQYKVGSEGQSRWLGCL